MRISELLARERYYTEIDFIRALSTYRENDRERLGHILLKHGRITAEQLAKALTAQEGPHVGAATR